jgi:hypothetical protein
LAAGRIGVAHEGAYAATPVEQLPYGRAALLTGGTDDQY